MEGLITWSVVGQAAAVWVLGCGAILILIILWDAIGRRRTRRRREP